MLPVLRRISVHFSSQRRTGRVPLSWYTGVNVAFGVVIGRMEPSSVIPRTYRETDIFGKILPNSYPKRAGYGKLTPIDLRVKTPASLLACTRILPEGGTLRVMPVSINSRNKSSILTGRTTFPPNLAQCEAVAPMRPWALYFSPESAFDCHRRQLIRYAGKKDPTLWAQWARRGF